MRKRNYFVIKITVQALLLLPTLSFAQKNVFGHALVPDMIADASIEYIDGTFYCYATTDGMGHHLSTSGNPTLWTSKDFVHWSFNGSYFPSAKGQLYWAPSKAIRANGKFYIYPTVNGIMHVGVADKPEGPFRLAQGKDEFLKPYSPDATLLKNGKREGIDAEIFIDDDGQPYVFWQHRQAAKMTRDMLSVDSTTIITIPTKQKAYSEGPIFFKRKGIYYFLYTIGGDENYKYYYMMSRVSPLGPFEAPEHDLVSATSVENGVFGPGHGCVFNDGENYYFAFLEFGRGSTNRQTYVNRLEFNEDGTIRQVDVTLDGVGALRNIDYGTRIPISRIEASSTARPLKIAHNKDVRCERTETFEPVFAIDQANGSRWMASESDHECWLMVDLGTPQYVGRSEIAFVRPTEGHAYVLEGSLDGKSWRCCGGHTDLQILSPHVDQVAQTFRYLRVRITQGIKGVWEWQLYREGTYKNPVLPADFSDIDCIKVGKDYYAMSSTFQFSPGNVILHSRNLTDWEICGHAVNELTQITPELNWDRMDRYARGIWAGSLRYHNGRFYCVFGTPDEGYFITTARKAEGPWKPLRQLLKDDGWDDCTLDWDENGKPWFLGTCFKDGYKTYLIPINDDCTVLDMNGKKLIHEGYGREASKLISHDGWHYLIFSEHHDKTGRYVVAKRSKSIIGPYHEERRLTRNISGDDEPNQGGIIEGPDGEWYFLTHHGHGQWYGRAVSLLPVKWVDGWPVPGTIAEDGMGVMTWEGKRPAEPLPVSHDIHENFEKKKLDSQLEWNYQPRKDHISQNTHEGYLRINASKQLKDGDLLKTPNMLSFRSWKAMVNTVTTYLDLSKMTEGTHAGICHFSDDWSTFGIRMENGEYVLESRTKSGVSDKTLGVVTSPRVWLRTSWNEDGTSTYSYNLDGQHFVDIGIKYQLKWGNYRGDRSAIYCYNNLDASGSIDIHSLEYISR